MPTFLLKPRWLGLLVFVLIFGAVCFRLGMWQWERHGERLERNEVIREHFSQPPVPLDRVTGSGDSVGKSDEWTSVTAEGTYDAKRSATVKFITRESAPGVDIVVPLKLADGTAILVNRGWIQTQNSVERPQLPAPPSGRVTISGWLRPNSSAGGQAVRLNGGQIRAIDSTGFGESVPYQLRDGYLNLRTESPSVPNPPAVEPDPDLSQGVHFFYALQWWFFMMIGLVGYIWFARSEAKELGVSPRRVKPA